MPPRRHFILLPILLALVAIGYQYLTADKFVNPETGSKARVSLSADQEAALGLQSYQQILSESKAITSGPEYDMVVRVAQRLERVVKPESGAYQWQVSLIQSDQVNAFCLPGGKIAVYSGILPIAKTEAGLATVLGHEIAHATSHHAAQRMFRAQAMQTALMGAQGSVSNMDYTQQREVLAVLGAGAQYGVLLPFSRDHESEADHIGLLYMARAGYDPHEAEAFWQRMAESSQGQPPQWASDHPSHGDRIRQIQEWMPAAEAEYAKASPAKSGAAEE